MTGGVRVPQGLKWSCGGCAACCRNGFDLGPVEPEVIADLEESAIGTLWAPAAEGFAEARQGPDGEVSYFLKQTGGACVFLRDDDRCAVHAILGGHRKPGFCREFPYHFVQDLRGWTAIIRADCGGFHRSFREAEPVGGPEVAEVLELPRVVPRRTFAPVTVTAFGTPVPLVAWLGWEDALEASLLAAPTLQPGPAFGLVREALASLVGVTPDPRTPDRARIAAQACLLALEHVLTQVAQQPGPPERVAFVRHMVGRLREARERTVAPCPEVSPELAAYLHLLLRSHLLARMWQPHAPEAGIGAFALGLGVGMALAAEPTPESFDGPYREWLRLSANPVITAIFRKATPALVDLLVHV